MEKGEICITIWAMVKPVFTLGLQNDAKAIREEVFIAEQGAKEEFDEFDDLCWCLVLYLDKTPIATGRLIRLDASRCAIGRLAVRKPYRGKRVGSYALRFLETKAREIGAVTIELHAQCDKIPFYQKNGYHISGDGEVFFEEGIPHQLMSKQLGNKKRRYYGRK